MKYEFFTAILFLSLVFFGAGFAFAQTKKVEIYFFYNPTCPRCIKETSFLEDLKIKYPELKITKFEIFKPENIDLVYRFYKKYNVPSQSYGYVPVTFIGEKYFIGFDEKDGTIGKNIENEIINLINQKQAPENKPEIENNEINLPFLGKINTNQYSLMTLTVILGLLDGFNICSLGALVLILSLVLALKSRNKTLIYGGLFILTTAFIYGILLIFWYKFFIFLGPQLKKMEILIGLLGIGGGIYFFRQYLKYRKTDSTCEIGLGDKISSRFSSKIQPILVDSKKWLAVLGAVILFAAAITIVEFPCSSVIPVIFTGLIANAKLATFTYIFYIVVYLFFYMLDEILVFLISVFTMKLWITSPKYTKIITLAESIILFLLGFFYLFGIK